MRRVTKIATPIAHLVGPGKLKVVNRQLAYSTGDEGGPLRLDTAALKRILCYGGVSISDAAFEILFAHDIEVAWLSPVGQRCRGRVVRSDPAHASLRLIQYRVLHDPQCQREAAGDLVRAKLASQHKAAEHYQRHGIPEVGPVLRQLRDLGERCGDATLDVLRGLEGGGSAAWFGLFARLLVAPWQFPGRVRRPPTDPVNALLSLGYTFLYTRTVAACEAAGLEIQLGALHEFRPGRASLACDLMEPLRVSAVDRWVVLLCNQQRLAPTDFQPDEEHGGLRLQRETFPVVLRDWEAHWQAGPEAALEERVEAFIAWLRRRDSSSVATQPEPDVDG